MENMIIIPCIVWSWQEHSMAALFFQPGGSCSAIFCHICFSPKSHLRKSWVRQIENEKSCWALILTGILILPIVKISVYILIKLEALLQLKTVLVYTIWWNYFVQLYLKLLSLFQSWECQRNSYSQLRVWRHKNLRWILKNKGDTVESISRVPNESLDGNCT